MCGVAFGQDVGTGRGGRGAGAQKGRCINRGEPNGSFRWGGGSGRGRADVQAGWRAPCVGSMTCPWSRADAHLVEVIGEPVAQGGRRATRRGLAHLTTADSFCSLLLNLDPRASDRRPSRCASAAFSTGRTRRVRSTRVSMRARTLRRVRECVAFVPRTCFRLSRRVRDVPHSSC